MLVRSALAFLALCTRSHAALAAENLFLRKQLAYYQERQAVPRRFDNPSRHLLVVLSRFFAWKDVSSNALRWLTENYWRCTRRSVYPERLEILARIIQFWPRPCCAHVHACR